MDHHVLLEVASRAESLITQLAHVRLLARMNTSMPNEIRYLREGVLTAWILAHVRFLLVVDPLMLLQATVLDERVPTFVALVRPLSCMSPQVLLERLLARESFMTVFVGAQEVALSLGLASSSWLVQYCFGGIFFLH